MVTVRGGSARYARVRPRRAPVVAAAVLAAMALAAPASAASASAAAPAVAAVPAVVAAPAGAAASTYRNPVSAGFADTFADPSVLRGRDGWWYAYATTDPLRAGETTPHPVPMARSRDLVTWSYLGDALAGAARPAWAAPDAAFWAPDIRYAGGRYLLYYVVTQTTLTPEQNDNAIGVATAPSPAGPWTDSGAPVVAPRHGPGGAGDFRWTYDPALVSDVDGRLYLYYGSYYGGIFAVPLTPDGTRSAGAPTMVAIDNKYEGAYAVRRGGWYYLFASSGDCCAGPTTGYSVFAGRSRSPLGPFLDRNGVPLTASRTGGTPVITPNGNRWVGTGHMAVTTDLAGQDWLVYHAIDRAAPYLNEPFGINRRPMLVDRLDWPGGWPTVRAGLGASAGPRPAPATVDSRRPVTGPAHVRAAVRLADPAGTAGLAVGAGTAIVDGRRQVLTVRSGAAARSAPIPAGISRTDWLDLTVDTRPGHLSATLGPAGYPLVTVDLPAPLAAGPVRAVGAELADVTAAPAARPATRAVPDPVPGRRLVAGDEFGAGGIGAQWTWVRAPAALPVVAGGQLTWPTQDADLSRDSNTASVLLLATTPAGPYTVDTKVSVDLGENDVRNFQQAGLIAYAGDDTFARLAHVAIWNTRQTEFGTDLPYAGRAQYGSMSVAPPADTTWLRLWHTIGPAGEHLFRAAVSTDGRHWTWGGSWALPAGSDPRIGLISHGGAGATARFDYLRVTR
jgi:arabinan endo-1,5-alpha-L-arabinosidase